jgi:type IV secretory pathway VirB6-like protein
MMIKSATIQNYLQAIGKIALVAIVFCVLSYAMSGDVYAANQECTDQPGFDVMPQNGGGLIGIIVQNVKRILNTVSSQMYNGIIGDGTFIAAVKGGATLYIAIYGLMFTIGMVQVTISDLTIRCVKVGIVSMLIAGGSWNFFNGTVKYFFEQGTDDLINQVTAIAVHGVAVNGAAPFSMLDQVLTKALSTKMIVTVMAIFTSGPYGVPAGLLIIAAIGAFLRSVFKAMWVYLMALVMKALLFGIAPMFIACILFTRTKHIFDGWLNQLLNASLQPILLFAFFAFFAKLIEASIDQVMQVPVCWTQMSEGMRGSRFAHMFWRFKVDSGNGMQEFAGLFGFEGPMPTMSGGIIQDIKKFFDPVVFITFFLLAELATRFNDIVIEVAKDIAGASTNLSAMSGSMQKWLNETLGIDGGGKSDGHPGSEKKGGGDDGKPNPRDKLMEAMTKNDGAAVKDFVKQAVTPIVRRPRPGGGR